MKKDFLHISDLTSDEIFEILEKSKWIKNQFKQILFHLTYLLQTDGNKSATMTNISRRPIIIANPNIILKI